MTAVKIVRSLLEDDVDPIEFIDRTLAPDVERLKAALADRGWRKVHLERTPVDGLSHQWELSAEVIDYAGRSEASRQGCRVYVPHPLAAPENITRIFAQAARSAKMRVLEVELVDAVPAHTGIDLEQGHEDFDDVPGDWTVTLIFTYDPLRR